MKKISVIAAGTLFFACAHAQKPSKISLEPHIDSYFANNSACIPSSLPNDSTLNPNLLCKSDLGIVLPKSGEFILDIYWWSRKVASIDGKNTLRGLTTRFNLYEFGSTTTSLSSSTDENRVFQICNRQKPMVLIALCKEKPLIILNPLMESVWPNIIRRVYIQPFEVVAVNDLYE